MMPAASTIAIKPNSAERPQLGVSGSSAIGWKADWLLVGRSPDIADIQVLVSGVDSKWKSEQAWEAF
jgi:hypothetical protein